jgi:menaquinone-dependent protoporphyrinogen oxidase
MRILVAAASRHAATAEIASRIGGTLADQLHARGIPVEIHVRHAEEVHDLAGYDAVVLGSAVYEGRWLKPARELVRDHADQLRLVPVWLFSSGPVGDPVVPAAEPREAGQLVLSTGAREHRVFPGRLDRRRLGHLERLLARAGSAGEGDYRDWGTITAWAADIADALCLVG